MKESLFVTKAIALICEHGGYAVKKHESEIQAGEPDIDGCYRGRKLALEAKKPDNPQAKYRVPRWRLPEIPEDLRIWVERGATLLQADTLQRWSRAGAVANVVDSLDQVQAILREIDQEAGR